MMNIVDVDILIKLGLTLVCGAILGVEREQKRKSAGLRTNILVCFGACLGGILAQYVFTTYNAGDPARICAAVIQGIGFLGAGVIIFSHDKLSGITTATDLWCMTIIGLIIGFGLYIVAIIGAVLLWFINHVLVYFERKLFDKSWGEVRFKFKNMKSLWAVRKMMEINKISVFSHHIVDDMYVMKIKAISEIDQAKMYAELKDIDGITDILVF